MIRIIINRVISTTSPDEEKGHFIILSNTVYDLYIVHFVIVCLDDIIPTPLPLYP